MSADEEEPVERRSALDTLRSLDFLSDVDMMLMSGTPTSDVSYYVVHDMGEMGSFKIQAVEDALRRHRRDLRSGEVEPESPALMRPNSVSSYVSVFDISKAGYRRSKSGMDALIEMESLYIGIKHYIDTAMRQVHNNPAERLKLAPDFQAAKDLLKEYAKLSNELGMNEMDSVTLRVTGSRAMRALETPEARHKVLTLVNNMRSIGVGTVEAQGSEVE